MTRRLWLAAILFAVVGSLTSVLLARQGVVKTKDGQQLSGDIDENTDAANVGITIHGVKTSVARTNVDTITYSDSLPKEFADRLAKLDSKDVAGRLTLARWAFEHHQYDLARQAALEAQRLDPHNPDAAALLETIQSQQLMEARHPATAPTHNPTPDTATPTAPAAAKYLSDEQINLVRQFELKSQDADVRVNFANDVKRRYIIAEKLDADRFNSASAADQALAIIGTGDARMAKDVHILSDPSALAEFHMHVLPRILSGCAASGCHGGPGAGAFFLYRNSDSAAAWYTDFYILQKTQVRVDGVQTINGRASVMTPIIDRSRPELSLLLQYGLPERLASTPHPTVPNFKPLFTTDSDPGYQLVVRWMGESLKPFAADYPFTFELPGGKSTTQPSTRPADGATPH